MPIKWTAPEILSGNVAELSTQSDVYVQYVWDIAQLVRSRWLDIGQVLFFCEFVARDGVEVHKLIKRERGQYPVILTEQAWSIITT